jgi:hypothetical protein
MSDDPSKTTALRSHRARACWRNSAWWQLGALLIVCFSCAARAEGSDPAPLRCAVEGSVRPLRPAELCRELQRELGRPLTFVEDGRAVKRGAAVQFIHDDVHWVAIWLVDSRIRAWTRVSKTEAADDQVRFLARAVRALAKAAREQEPHCVRLDPNAGHKMRSADLSYPWAELERCPRRWVEVVDPWWLPGDSQKPK